MKENRLFSNKVVLVTGASSGIGREAAVKYAGEGARLLITGRNAARLTECEDKVKRTGCEVLALPGDLKDASFRTNLIHRCRRQFERLDILLNAAGVIAGGTLENTSLEAFEEMHRINLYSMFHLMQLALPMLKSSRGNILNVSSVTGLRAFPGVMAYCVSKAAVDQMTRCAALELAPDGVRVNAINPGVVVTNLHRAGGMDEEAYTLFLERSKETHPLGRTGQPGEVADLILFLTSERAGWITGETISIDGGRAQTCAR